MSTKSEKVTKCEKLWLLYFNQYLYDKGVITEKERNLMKLSIESR